MRRLRVVPPVRKPVRGRSFERLAGAVLERRRLRLTIALDDGGGERERIVSPLRMIHDGGIWLLDAWCHEREALCRIPVPSVRAVQWLELRAREVPMRVIEAELDAMPVRRAA